MVKRKLATTLKALAQEFPAISLTGPRQSGKTTLVKEVFKKYEYLSLENPDTREFAKEDPRRFLNLHKKGVILDEVQRVPELFSFLQEIIDETKNPGRYILTGSQNFLLLENITQSLAGRVAILHLLPLSLEELKPQKFLPDNADEVMVKGLYPVLYSRKISTEQWYASYITTYLERDVRHMKQIGDLDIFQKFMRLCAGRSGQLLNLSELGNECGITHTTAKSWISVLQASFIITLLQPYHGNFNKRLVKQPKLYFNDTGLLCALLGIENPSQLTNHYYRGAIFETMIISELMKYQYHRGKIHKGFFWRDHRGNEIDYLFEREKQVVPVEIKSGETVKSDFFRSLKYFSEIFHQKAVFPSLVYGGLRNQKRKEANILSWRNSSQVFETQKF